MTDFIDPAVRRVDWLRGVSCIGWVVAPFTTVRTVRPYRVL